MRLLRCPNEACLSTEFLHVSVETWRNIDQTNPDNTETMDALDGDNSEFWDDDSSARCFNCNWIGRVFELDQGLD